MSAILLSVVLHAVCAGAELGIEGTRFTVDGQPTFLLGISYYGALAIDDPALVASDLDTMRETGINWIRVWVTWNAFDHNVSAVAPDGSPREPYQSRLKTLCELAGARGIVVDVTVTRGNSPDFPSHYREHAATMGVLARELLPYRNVYFDVGNERNIGDDRHVPMEEVGRLVEHIKAIDPKRICTASQGGDIGDEELADYLAVARIDFIAPHRPRHAGSAAETGRYTSHYLEVSRGLGAVPVHYQEPFRRGYQDWQPTLEDFQRDLIAAQSAGAAGWCLHNGSVRNSGDDSDGRPRRSFDLRPGEGRLWDQLDSVERAFIDWLRQHQHDGIRR